MRADDRDLNPLTAATLRTVRALRASTSLGRLSDSDFALLLAEVERVGPHGLTGWMADRLVRASAEAVDKHLGGKHDQSTHGKGGGRKLHPGPPLDDKQVASFKGGSAEAHLVPDGKGGVRFSDERQALHDQIVRDATSGVPSQEEPRFVMMGGGPASGKSSILGKEGVDVPGDGEAVEIDSDKIKGQLPEYQSMVAAGDSRAAAFSHEESSYLSKRIQAEAFAGRQHVVLDGTGDSTPGSVQSKIDAARLSGYRVEANYVTCDTSTAISRATSRGERTGRIVPESVIIQTHAGVSQTFPEVYSSFDSVKLFDTNVGVKLIAQSTLGSALDILDAEAYAAFLAKGTTG